MRIKTLIKIPKNVDGKPVGPFDNGKEYDVPDKLGKLFIDSKMAEEVKPPAPAKPSRKKNNAEQNKGSAKSTASKDGGSKT